VRVKVNFYAIMISAFGLLGASYELHVQEKDVCMKQGKECYLPS